jgi:hypothetical protein
VIELQRQAVRLGSIVGKLHDVDPQALRLAEDVAHQQPVRLEPERHLGHAETGQAPFSRGGR